MRMLTIALVSSEEFLSHYRESGATGEVYARSRAELGEGELLLMDISFPGLPNRALLRGKVTEVTPGVGGWIECHPDDAPAREFLLQVARREISRAPTINRCCDRFPADLPVDCRIEAAGGRASQRLVTRTTDLGAGGAFIRSLSPPPVGARVHLSIGPAAGPAGRELEMLSLNGHVAWTRLDSHSKGFGVRFDDKANFDARLLRTTLRRASETGRVAFGS